MITQFASEQFTSGDRSAAGKAAGITGRRRGRGGVAAGHAYANDTSNRYFRLIHKRRASLLNEHRRRRRYQINVTRRDARALY